jgi:hypothetical protein
MGIPQYIIISEISGTIRALTAISPSVWSNSPDIPAYVFDSFTEAACEAYRSNGQIVRVA